MVYTPVVLSSLAVHQPIELSKGEAVLIVEEPQRPALIFPPISVTGGKYEVNLILDGHGRPEQVILRPVKKDGEAAKGVDTTPSMN